MIKDDATIFSNNASFRVRNWQVTTESGERILVSESWWNSDLSCFLLHWSAFQFPGKWGDPIAINQADKLSEMPATYRNGIPLNADAQCHSKLKLLSSTSGGLGYHYVHLPQIFDYSFYPCCIIVPRWESASAPILPFRIMSDPKGESKVLSWHKPTGTWMRNNWSGRKGNIIRIKALPGSAPRSSQFGWHWLIRLNHETVQTQSISIPSILGRELVIALNSKSSELFTPASSVDSAPALAAVPFHTVASVFTIYYYLLVTCCSQVPPPMGHSCTVQQAEWVN